MNIASWAALMIGLGLCSNAQAVYLNPRGLGQVLIYPYYTVNANQSTLLSIVNTTRNGKALRVAFHEGYNGRDVLDFNLYLSPYDVWTAEVFLGTGNDAPTFISTSDASCTFPTLHTVKFSTNAFIGALSDTGPQDNARTREGYFDVIEMGEVVDGPQHTLEAIEHIDGVPFKCAQITTAWANGGYWATDPSVDLAPPAGGLYGAEAIVDVPQGTIFMLDAAALDGFSASIQHTPGFGIPDLRSANDGTGTSGATAQVPVGGKWLTLHYEHSVDAVSALFMADNLYNEFEVDPAYGAQTDWIVTFPTKHFYVDPIYFGNPDSVGLFPFDEEFGSIAAGQSCSPYSPLIFDREESTFAGGFCGVPPPGTPFSMCFETSVLTFGTAHSLLGSALLSDGSTIRDPVNFGPLVFKSGHLGVNFTNALNMCGNTTPSQSHWLADDSATTLFGMPALGFAARGYVNADAIDGVLANYTAVLPHRASVTCSINTSPPALCQ